MNVNVYLNFNGGTEEAFNYYKSVFKSEFKNVVYYIDMSKSNEILIFLHSKIIHISLLISKVTLMSSNATLEMGQVLVDKNVHNS